MRVILPGSYDPVTLGHLDLIRRAAAAYDEVYAVIFQNPEKVCTFSLTERVSMLTLATEELDNVLVSYSHGLVIDYMREHDIDLIVKGYRDEVDLAYEQQQAAWNKQHGGYDTELLPCTDELRDVRSTHARRMLQNGGDLSELLPACVIDYIRTTDHL